MEETPVCEECGVKLVGRVDKRFCSADCRSAFNNKKNKVQTNYMRNVNRMLRNNRKILESLNPDGKTVVTKQQLLLKGFMFDYITRIYTTKKGTVYHFCYEYGYMPIEGDRFVLVQQQES